MISSQVSNYKNCEKEKKEKEKSTLKRTIEDVHPLFNFLGVLHFLVTAWGGQGREVESCFRLKIDSDSLFVNVHSELALLLIPNEKSGSPTMLPDVLLVMIT